MTKTRELQLRRKPRVTARSATRVNTNPKEQKSKYKELVIAATSDIHGFLDGLEENVKKSNPDILVIAGDVNPCRIDINSDDWFCKKFFPFIESLGIPVVLTPGNHDFWLNELLSKPIDMKKSEIPSNLHILCDSEETICGVKFYGSPWCPWINGKWCWEASDETLKYVFSKIPYDVDVLVTHSPPLIKHGFVDISLEKPKPYWRHFGSKELTAEILKKRPGISICGHIHSGQHGGVSIKDEYGSEVCKCYNVSRVDEIYSVKFPLALIKYFKKSERTA